MAKIGKRALQKILSESAIDFNAPGPARIIADQDDPNYYEIRAIELIQEARSHLPTDRSDYHYRIKLAISLLALSRLGRGIDETSKKEDC